MNILGINSRRFITKGGLVIEKYGKTKQRNDASFNTNETRSLLEKESRIISWTAPYMAELLKRNKKKYANDIKKNV